jgi:hypothetical protein
MKDEIKTIEYTLINIFKKDKITNDDVVIANKLFEKWKRLKTIKEENILDEEPSWQTKNEEQ